jgi:lysophospholipase L1-like esterase
MLKKIILLFSVVMVLIMSAFIQKKSKKVIFFGDSITEMGIQKDGYIDLVKRYAQNENPDQFEILGAGIGGNKVYDLYLRMEEDVLSKSPDVVFIYVGINDVWHKRTHGTGTDADKFEKFYNAIIRRMKDQGIQVVLCTPSVIGERNDHSNEQDGELNYYSTIIRRIASENKIGLVDLRKVFLEYEGKNNPENLEKGILTTDRVHLNAAGNKLVAAEMWKVLDRD